MGLNACVGMSCVFVDGAKGGNFGWLGRHFL